jgi:hypothetical protein
VQISNDTVVGAGTVPTYPNDPRLLSWTDGSPTVNAPGNASGIYINGTGNGFSFTAPADLGPRRLTVHVGGWNSGGTLTAHLSDGSALDYVDVTTSVSSQYDRNYTLIYSAGNPAQTVTVSWVMTSGTGNVTLSGAALAVAGPSVTATAGGAQSTAVNTAFSTPLQAMVQDAVGNPLSGVTVTFLAPASGASAVFSGPTPVTAMTDPNGIATAPALTANGQVGGPYVVTASIVGATAANFSLTNTAGPPSAITVTTGSPQTTTVNTAFAASLQATVTDSANNPVSGVTVTFTAPGSGASAAFSGSSTTTAVTNSSGIASAPAPSANGQTGLYTVTASVSGVSASAGFSLTNNPPPPVGTLSGTGNSVSAAASLTTEGTADWVHWGDASLNRKAGAAAQITTYKVVGTGAVQSYNNDPRTLSWTDGSPTLSAPSNASGLYVNGTGNGFSITAPADTSARKLTVHVGGWLSGGTLTASLSDGSAQNFVDVTTPTSGQYDRNYTLIYSALTAGQTLSVKWVNTAGGGNVTLNGAALSTAGPSVTATAGNSQSTTVNAAFATPLQVVVKDSGGNPLPGVTVTFATPSSGASAVFSGPTPVTAITDGNGSAAAPALTASSQAGSYIVTASAPGASTASFSLTNTAGPAATIAATAGSSQSAAVNAPFATLLQATVTDSANNPVSGVTVTFTPPGSGASAAFKGPSPTTAVTGANGIATAPALTANATAGGPFTITAGVVGLATPANFSLTNTAGPPASVTVSAGGSQSAAINTAFATALQALVKDAAGNSLSGVTVTFAAPGNGPSAAFTGTAPITAVTGANGIATAPGLTANGQVGGPYTVTARVTGVTTPASFSLTNTAGTPASIAMAAGGSQSATVNTRFATLLQALVKDTNNNPLSGVTVTFATPTSGPSAAFIGTAPATAVTGANGLATAPALTANNQAGGPYTVTATVAGVTTPASFSLTNTAGPPASVTVMAGNSQSTTVNTAFSTNLQAVVKDASNNLVSGVVVTFAAPTAGASAAFGGPATATTNASGIATSSSLTANSQAGAYTVTASVANVTAKANFSLTNLPGPAASVTATAGSGQSTTVNLPFGTALQAVVKDASNNVLSGVTVTFTAPTTGATASFGGSNSATALTNPSGIATAPAMTANGQAGSYSVTASVAGVGAPANFSLTNSLPAAVPIKLVQGNTLDSMINLQSASVAFKSNNTAGNWIGVVISGSTSNTDTFTVSDSKGNVYHPALVFGGASLNTTLAVYYAENVKAGANAVRVVPNTGVYLRIAIVEYSGIATANSLDVTAAAQGNSASANSGNATTTAAGDLLLGALITKNGHSLAGSGGYTFEQFVPAPPNTRLSTEDQVQTGSGTTSANATLGAGDNWILGLAAFKAAH